MRLLGHSSRLKLDGLFCWIFHRNRFVFELRHTRRNTNDFIVVLRCALCDNDWTATKQWEPRLNRFL